MEREVGGGGVKMGEMRLARRAVMGMPRGPAGLRSGRRGSESRPPGLGINAGTRNRRRDSESTPGLGINAGTRNRWEGRCRPDSAPKEPVLGPAETSAAASVAAA